MDCDRLQLLLDDPAAAAAWLRTWGLADPHRGLANLRSIEHAGVPLDLLAVMAGQLQAELPASSDPDRALNNLERFVAAARSPLALATLFERDAEALPILLQLFAGSQHLSDLLIQDSESYDLLRMTEGQPMQREALLADVLSEVLALADDPPAVLTALRRFKRRETLRICYGDLIRGQPVEVVTRQISYLADALVEGALAAARHRLDQKRAAARPAAPVPVAVLALGKLGGLELNYSSDVDLLFLYDPGRGADAGRLHQASEYAERLAREVVRLLTEPTELGTVYRVDLRLRPAGQASPIAVSLDAALHYYDVSGRTWERQAFVKARPIAGDHQLGRSLLGQLEPWIYRRYLSRADITGIKALKRRIEQRTRSAGDDQRHVKTGHGGIRDVEFVIQFLQLLNGGDLPALRTGNTLEAIGQLERCGCLTNQERVILEENYRFLRKIEHRLQIMFDLQTHLLPAQPDELRKLALRLGYVDDPPQSALAAFEADYQHRTRLNRQILDHLLHDAFADEGHAAPETDLVLDPEPSDVQVREVLGRYAFRDLPQAYRNLMDLAAEKIRFLSTRRCRHFLAAIAPQLLAAIARTPDPDGTLVNLCQVSASLGGKGVLWELFSWNPPTLKLYVELCSSSQYLAGILTSNPGMVDELLDSLLLDKLPTLPLLRETLADVCRGAEDLEPILHSFKSAQQLGVGVRHILGKEPVEALGGALSDVAQALLEQVILAELARLSAKLGQPTCGDGETPGGPCELLVLALGKFGGRELNYYSDLDLVFLYQADGQTVQSRRSRRDTTTLNQHFFSEVGQRIIKQAGQLGPFGRLYEIDARLRPTGRSGSLATSLAEFRRYFQEGHGQLWERQALCKARPVFGSEPARQTLLAAVHEAAYQGPFGPDDVQAIGQMRARLEESSQPGNLKRGPGGVVDIEFLVQMLQLQFGRHEPAIRCPDTLSALAALHQAGHLQRADCAYLTESFRFLRQLQARLRLMSTTARDNLPDDPQELERLARGLGYDRGEALRADCENYVRENRRRFHRLLEEATRSAKVN